MIKNVALILVLVLTASGTVAFLPVNAESGTIVVPDDYPTIGDAVVNAPEGATIYLKVGTYEMLVYPIEISKTLSIVGEDQANVILAFPNNTRTGYDYVDRRVAFRVYADNCMFSNLTITNCDYGVFVTANKAQISNVTTSRLYLNGSHCKISENKLNAGGIRSHQAIDITGSFNEITYNKLMNVQCKGSFTRIIGNTGVKNEIEVTGHSNFVAENNVSSIILSNSNSTTVYKNAVSHLSLENCYNNTVCGNIIKGPTNFYGLLMCEPRSCYSALSS